MKSLSDSFYYSSSGWFYFLLCFPILFLFWKKVLGTVPNIAIYYRLVFTPIVLSSPSPEIKGKEKEVTPLFLPSTIWLFDQTSAMSQFEQFQFMFKPLILSILFLVILGLFQSVSIIIGKILIFIFPSGVLVIFCLLQLFFFYSLCLVIDPFRQFYIGCSDNIQT